MANGMLQSYNLLGIQRLNSYFSRILPGFLVLLILNELEQDVLSLLMQAIFHLLQPSFDCCQVTQAQNPLENRPDFQFVAVHLLPVFEIGNKHFPKLFLQQSRLHELLVGVTYHHLTFTVNSIQVIQILFLIVSFFYSWGDLLVFSLIDPLINLSHLLSIVLNLGVPSKGHAAF